MPPLEGHRPTWAEIDLDALAFNFHSVKEFIGSEIRYMAVVKADAYGHGTIECARRLEAEGIDWFAVALPEEGVELRSAGITKPILCLGGFWEGQEALIIENSLTPVLFRLEQAKALNAAAGSRGIISEVHIKIDTGMGRVGIRLDQVDRFAAKLAEYRNIKVDGIMTHFAAADNLKENEFTDRQISRFQDAVSIFKAKGFAPEYLDLANSPGAVAHPSSRGNMVRLGGVLYGLGGDVLPHEIPLPKLRAVMSVHSRVATVKNVPSEETIGYGRTFTTKRDSVIATIPIGYHDGLRRSLSNLGTVIIGGKRAPIVGRVSMDWTIVDVTDIVGVNVGDEVTIIGTQGGSTITAEEIAADLGTISYEVTCLMNGRVPRVYLTDGRAFEHKRI